MSKEEHTNKFNSDYGLQTCKNLSHHGEGGKRLTRKKQGEKKVRLKKRKVRVKSEGGEREDHREVMKRALLLLQLLLQAALASFSNQGAGMHCTMQKL